LARNLINITESVMTPSIVVDTASGLADALQSDATEITINGVISGMPMITLKPGVTLRGGTLEFGAKGVRLTRDNTLDGVTVLAEDDEVAILNDTGVSDFGTLTLRDVRTTGQVLLLAEDAVRRGRVRVERLMVDRADVRGRVERPRGFGVEALQGAFTLWNRQADPGVVITAELLDISAGSAKTPVRGSGVFVGGHGNWDGMADDGTLQVTTLRTGEIHADGRIPPGTPDLISGGVFVISGAVVKEVVNVGPVTTYGQNDMVLDNWGSVETWTAKAAVTSRGPSGIGFVNFGQIGQLVVQAPIQTFGAGARGFNLYDGALQHASFTNIATHGDGSVGVQVSKPLPVLDIAGDLTTEGGEGQSLVKGVQVTLKAVALSVKPSGALDRITVGGRIRTSGNDVVTVEIDGNVGELVAARGIFAHGRNSDAIHTADQSLALDHLTVRADHGQEIVHTG
jgi:hypothetical protein